MSEKEEKMESILTENRIFKPVDLNPEYAKTGMSFEEYKKEYKRSIEDMEGFWGDQADSLDWFKPYNKVWEKTDLFPGKWFVGGKLNVSYNCIDRHIKNGKGDQVAIIWEADEPGEVRKFTFNELKEEVCKVANGMKKLGMKKGDRVTIWLPMLPELAIIMLACARLGVIHSIVFGGFSKEAVKDRIEDSDSRLLFTSDETFRAGKTYPKMADVVQIIDDVPTIEHVIVVERTGNEVPHTDKDIWYKDFIDGMDTECECEEMDSEDTLFILYTSGTTGKPKGVKHTTAGYLLYTSFTHRVVFNYKEGDVWYCTADIGWITGHSYIVYGPLANGATTLMFESVPTYPDVDRFWDIVERHKVTQFYTAPTAIRALMRYGEEPVNKHDLSSLRVLGTVGEPINPEAWTWYHRVIGKERCPIVDTYWQTETGGFIMTPIATATPTKPGSCCLPFLGIKPVIYDAEGNEITEADEGGYFCMGQPWPGMLRDVWGNTERFISTYLSRYEGNYYTGDGARMDSDGYYWILGRLDDVIKVSGHRIGTMEVESAIVSHPKVAEAAVAPFPHKIKGNAIWAFVTTMEGVEGTEELQKEIILHVREEIGPVFQPDVVQFADALPKTRSGKIMRRILKAIASGTDIGNTTTLADPSVVDDLLAERKKMDV
ncbi:MAG: acetate--CoA ligase [Candidatus Lokiarchaeota archaeon]|nr:acetate--CoA ligase [Candidatus Lokiarchaeota archaeon]MBD3199052.1 acetate--CoA ligase [Candidatus Lokiarchaeota archaeon]